MNHTHLATNRTTRLTGSETQKWRPSRAAAGSAVGIVSVRGSGRPLSIIIPLQPQRGDTFGVCRITLVPFPLPRKGKRDEHYWVGHVNCGFFGIRAPPSPPPSNHKPRQLDTTHSARVSQFSCPRCRLFCAFFMIRRRGGGGRAGINTTSQFSCPTLYRSAGGCVRLPTRISSGSFFEIFEVRLRLFGSARAGG